MAVKAECNMLRLALVRNWTSDLGVCPNTLKPLCLNWVRLSHSDTLSMAARSWLH